MGRQKISRQVKGQKNPIWWAEEYEAVYRNLLLEKGEEEATQWKKALFKRYAPIPEAKLREVFRLINSPLSEDEEGQYEAAKAWVHLYTYFDPLKIDYPTVLDGKVIG